MTTTRSPTGSGPSARYWPPHFSRTLRRPATTLHTNLEIAAARFGSQPAIEFLGRTITYREFKEYADAFAGWLQKVAGVKRGDRVMLYLQNSPQWLFAYYGTLRADAVVVPINPMNRTEELRHYLRDSGAKVAVCAQDIAEYLIAAARGTDVTSIVSATYSDLLPNPLEYEVPEWVTEGFRPVTGTVPWREVIAATKTPGPTLAQPEDFALMPYTSGSTGVPKACIHPHRTFMHIAAGSMIWHAQSTTTVFLGVAPMYQVSGLLNCVNGPVYAGATVVPVPRWNRKLAANLIQRYRVNRVTLQPTAIIDLLSEPGIEHYDLSSITRIASGGSLMPAAVWKRLRDMLGLPFIECYGMTEAAATTHLNPYERPKAQCLGIPFFDTESFVIDPDTHAICAPTETGEIVIRGPQIFSGYWNRPEETEAAFVEIEGQRYYRSGDIGYMDEEGYYFMTDRLKRMINASGFKVWPAEVESRLYDHPDVLEACVVGAHDPYRGETVKAVVVLKPDHKGRVSAEELIEWSKTRMAAYKYPRSVEFVDALPKSQVGKVLWRVLQDRENATASASAKGEMGDTR